VLLEVSNVNNGVRLTVHDRVGFPDEIEQISGVSLRVMKLRARMIGARLEVERDSGGGYHLTCLLLPAAA
jgi:signal transduction histidine kinase